MSTMILQDIETQIAGLKTTTTQSNVGVVREVGDGVARIEGLSDVMLNEAIEFPNPDDPANPVIGLALNLEETEVGAILLGNFEGIVAGSEVRTTGKLLSVPVGKGLLGRVVNSLGQPIDGKGRSRARRLTRSKTSRRASSSAKASASRCKRASWPWTR